MRICILFATQLSPTTDRNYHIMSSEPSEPSLPSFIERDCISKPLLNVQPSLVDKTYFGRMRSFIDNSVRNFLNETNIDNFHIVDIGLTGYSKSIQNESVVYETIDIDATNNPTYVCDITKNNTDVIHSDRFDITIITEVLEHTENPIAGLEECLRITKKGGYVVITTPLNFRIHGPLYDTFRMTEWFYKNYFNKRGINIVKMAALEDASRTLYPISYFIVVQK